MLKRMRKALKLAVMVVAVLAVLALAPVLWVEASCYVEAEPDRAPFQSSLDAGDRRDEVNTYLTYPEWSIVYAYEDFAGVTRMGSESDFAYFRSIRSYWTSLCSVTRIASRRGMVPSDTKSMLYVIGISFAAEMGIKGAYEETIGRITSVIRGEVRTAEDDFALMVADDYAGFLRQTPWYQYPFGERLKAFWSETPLLGSNFIRKIERRFALTLEYGVKAVYAKFIGFLAGLDPAPLSIRSVVTGLDARDIDSLRNVLIVKALPGDASIIETPRYRTFTEIIRVLAVRGENFTEIAGNRDILVTVLAREDLKIDLPAAKPLFEVPLQAQPGWHRVGLDVEVTSLTELIRNIAGPDIRLEHVYDY